MNLPFKDGIGRAERDNAIDVYIGDEYMDVLADGVGKDISQRNLKYLQRRKESMAGSDDRCYTWI